MSSAQIFDKIYHTIPIWVYAVVAGVLVLLVILTVVLAIRMRKNRDDIEDRNVPIVKVHISPSPASSSSSRASRAASPVVSGSMKSVLFDGEAEKGEDEEMQKSPTSKEFPAISNEVKSSPINVSANNARRNSASFNPEWGKLSSVYSADHQQPTTYYTRK